MEESLINLTNKWICFFVKSAGDQPSLIPQNCDEMHHFLCEDTNSGKIFHESWNKCLLRNDFMWSKEKSSTAGKVKTITKQTNVVKTSIQYFPCKMPSLKFFFFFLSFTMKLNEANLDVRNQFVAFHRDHMTLAFLRGAMYTEGKGSC